jgi:starvation-inducible DNA-binding protein
VPIPFDSVAPYEAPIRLVLVDEVLNPLHLDTLAFASAVYLAHRNLTGPSFRDMHKVFGKFASALDGYVDEIPEHVAMLGGLAAGTAEQVADGSRLEPYPVDLTDGLAHCKAITDRAKALLAYYQAGLVQCDELGAAMTFDLLNQIMAGIAHHAWFVQAHIRSARGAQE